MNDVRVVELSHLEALCNEATLATPGASFWLEKVTKSRIWVGYDDGEETIYALFPCFSGDDRTWASMYVMRLIDEYYDAQDNHPEKVQLFTLLMEAPEMEKNRWGQWRPKSKYFFTEV